MKTETSIETTLAYQELKKLNVGEICPYSTLRAVIDKDPQIEGYAYVRSARRMVEREFECVLDVVPNEGIRRLPPPDVIKRGSKDLRHVRKSVVRGMGRQRTIVPIEQFNTLEKEEQSKFLTQLSHFGILRLLMNAKAVKQIEAKVDESAKMVPAKEMLRLFAKAPQPEPTIKPANDGMVKL